MVELLRDKKPFETLCTLIEYARPTRRHAQQQHWFMSLGVGGMAGEQVRPPLSVGLVAHFIHPTSLLYSTLYSYGFLAQITRPIELLAALDARGTAL